METASREEELTGESFAKHNCSQTWPVVIGNPVLVHAPVVGCCMDHSVLSNPKQSKESNEDGLLGAVARECPRRRRECIKGSRSIREHYAHRMQ